LHPLRIKYHAASIDSVRSINARTVPCVFNGILVKIGNKQSLDTSLNGTLTHSIKNLDG